MAYTLHIAEAAEGDIREALLWYEEQMEGLGYNFEKHISKALDSLREKPLKNQIRYGSVRMFFLKKFPYGIHFYVSDNNILIVAVFHTSRDPEKWDERKG
jgi:plasmid stabilization system protein ParE